MAKAKPAVKPKFRKRAVRKDGSAGKELGPGKFTAEKRALFLETYEAGGTVTRAANKVGISPVTIFKLVRKDPEGFGRDFYLAMEANTDSLEDRLLQLAIAGNVAALFGSLKARRPERWRDRSSVDLSNSDGSLSGLTERFAHAARERETHLRNEVKH